MKKQELCQLIKEEIQNVLNEKGISISGEFNDGDFEGPERKKAKKFLKSSEGLEAIQKIKQLISKDFDAFDLRKTLKKCKFPSMNAFKITAIKAGLELDTLDSDNEGNGNFGVWNDNYTSEGAAISFMHNKFYSVG